MGKVVVKMRDLLLNYGQYEGDDSAHVPLGTEITLDTDVEIVSSDDPGPRPRGALRGLMMEQFDHELHRIDQNLGRPATLDDRLRVILHYVENDAPMSLEELRNPTPPSEAA